MYLGPFFFDTKEIFLIIASFFLAAALFFGWDLMWFDRTSLLTITIIMLMTKGLLPAIHNEAFFILALVTIFMTVYVSVWQVVLFYFISFFLFRLMKVI